LQGLVKQFASARVSVYEQTGHSTFAEKPERFNAELREFALAVQGAAPH
jgi:pimeloyl-ACP methyl ester carboxylesterase